MRMKIISGVSFLVSLSSSTPDISGMRISEITISKDFFLSCCSASWADVVVDTSIPISCRYCSRNSRISGCCDLGFFRLQDFGVHLPNFGVVFQEGTGIAQQRNQFDRVLGLLAGPRKAKKVFNKLVQPVAFPEHDVHKTGVPLLQCQTGAQDLRRASN